jgi:hypothetical protein
MLTHNDGEGSPKRGHAEPPRTGEVARCGLTGLAGHCALLKGSTTPQHCPAPAPARSGGFPFQKREQLPQGLGRIADQMTSYSAFGWMPESFRLWRPGRPIVGGCHAASCDRRVKTYIESPDSRYCDAGADARDDTSTNGNRSAEGQSSSLPLPGTVHDCQSSRCNLRHTPGCRQNAGGCASAVFMQPPVSGFVT